jgi:hypothetical protein
MSKARLLILLVGPPLFVLASRALTEWWRPGGSGEHRGNHVLNAAEPPVRNPAARGPGVASAVAAPAVNPDELDRQSKAKAAELRPRLGAECSVLVRSPFVVAGDMTADELLGWYDRTIAPAARAMAYSYFKKPPIEPITVLLFTKEEPYDRYAKKLFNDEKVSVYGYYKPDRRTLVMNIDTGGGTLVHELTHALIVYDFPAVPDWFNEGLASLHEQCRFRPAGQGLEGLVNWRLPGLQSAIKGKRLVSLETLMTDDDFRGASIGVNYAQARYFCLWLQEKGLLTRYYERFRAGQKDDPQGVATARAVLGGKEWSKIDAEFQAWAMGLER